MLVGLAFLFSLLCLLHLHFLPKYLSRRWLRVLCNYPVRAYSLCSLPLFHVCTGSNHVCR